MTEQTELSIYEADNNLPIINLNDELQRAGLLAPKIPAKELVNREFVIHYAQPFTSSFDAERHCYFVRASDPLTGEIFTTVLGGQAIVDVLDLLRSAEFHNPLLVKLAHIKQGSYEGYYVFETPSKDDEDKIPF